MVENVNLSSSARLSEVVPAGKELCLCMDYGGYAFWVVDRKYD